MFLFIPFRIYKLVNTKFAITYSYTLIRITFLLADSWEDIKDQHGRPLLIGVHHFTKKVKVSNGFVAANDAREVLAALELSTKLFLEESSVPDLQSRLDDSLMTLIKASSAPSLHDGVIINNNSFGRVNKKFVRFFVDMLSLQLLFNNWYPFAAQVAPSPYSKLTPLEVSNALQRNQSILVSLAVRMNPLAQSMYMENGSMGWTFPSIKQLFTTAVNYSNKFKKGIISSWDGYSENNVSIINYCHFFHIVCKLSLTCHIQDCLWIHHWVMLQFVVPNLSVDKLDDLEGRHADGTLHFPFRHQNWEDFVQIMDEGCQSRYIQSYGQIPKFGLIWLGERVIPNL